jgi:hypothetical protein
MKEQRSKTGTLYILDILMISLPLTLTLSATVYTGTIAHDT